MRKIISTSILFLFTFLFAFYLSTNSVYARGCGKPSDCGVGETCDAATKQCVPGEKPGTVTDPGDTDVAPSTSDNPALCDGGTGINTAVGCIPFNDTNALVGFILGWAIGIGGGLAFLLMLYAGFMILSSQGNPERLKAGQELLTSAIAGVIMLVFSVFILKFIGVDILKLPGFGE
jgi:hypothetical protein